MQRFLPNAARSIALAAVLSMAIALAATPAGAVWSGTDGKLVFFKTDFASEQPIAQIYSMNRPGNGEKNLTAKGGSDEEVDIQPSVAPDGKHIAFASLDFATGSAQIWTMTFEGLRRTNISN